MKNIPDKIIYYAVYDIMDNGRRDAVIEILKDSGMVRIQKSVFCGGLVLQQKRDLIETIKSTLNVDDDSFYLIMNCGKCYRNATIVGKGFDQEYVEGKTSSMVF